MQYGFGSHHILVWVQMLVQPDPNSNLFSSLIGVTGHMNGTQVEHIEYLMHLATVVLIPQFYLYMTDHIIQNSLTIQLSAIQ